MSNSSQLNVMNEKTQICRGVKSGTIIKSDKIRFVNANVA